MTSLLARRCATNPLIRPEDVRPSNTRFKVVGAFNPGATLLPDGSTLLLVRVAEAYCHHEPGFVSVPTAKPTIVTMNALLTEGTDNVVEVRLSVDDPQYDLKTDARVVLCPRTKTVRYLTSLSHLRCARSNDGVQFHVDEKPFLAPGLSVVNDLGDDSTVDVAAEEQLLAMEEWGIEDPRIVDMDLSSSDLRAALPHNIGSTLSAEVEWRFLVTYTAVSRFGAATAAAAVSSDFAKVRRLGIIFAPENKDVCIFPSIDSTPFKRVFYCYHRPVPKSFGNPDIWGAQSTDLLSWGCHRHVLGTETSTAGALSWDAGRVGGGAPSVRTEQGWLHIYHAADVRHRYCLGAFLADLSNPSRVIARAALPILCPEEEYEVNGFFPNVVFTCGVVVRSLEERNGSGVMAKSTDELWIYYGAADDKVALCVFPLQTILELLLPQGF